MEPTPEHMERQQHSYPYATMTSQPRWAQLGQGGYSLHASWNAWHLHAGSCVLDLELASEDFEQEGEAALYPVNAARNRALILARTEASWQGSIEGDWGAAQGCKRSRDCFSAGACACCCLAAVAVAATHAALV